MRSLKRLFRGLLAASVLAVTLMFVMKPIQAAADDRCTPYVVDDAKIFGDQTQELTAAVKSLEEVGADGRVVTIQSFGNSGSLDTYVDQMARGCVAWQMSGQLKQNFFVLAIAMDERKTTIYYGTLWKSSFDNQAARIQSGEMAPLFQQGRFADGMIAGIAAIKSVIESPLPPSGGGNPVPPSNPEPSVPVEPFNWAPVLNVIGVIAGIAAVLALLYWLFAAVIRPRRETKKLQRQAISLKAEATSQVARLDTDLSESEFTAQFEDFSVVGGEVETQAKNALLEARTCLAEAQAGLVAAAKLGDPGHWLDDEKYRRIISAYKSILASVQAGSDHRESLTAKHNDLLSEANRLVEQIEDFYGQLQEANTSLLIVSESGFDITELSADLTKVSKEVASYRGLHDASALMLIGVSPRLSVEVERSVQAVTGCQIQLDACRNELAVLPALHQAAVDKRLPAQTAFDKMSTEYAKSAWANIAGNGSKADKLLFRAKEMLDQVTHGSVKSLSQLEERLVSLAKIRQLIEDGDDLLDAIIARESNIAEAQASAAEEISLAETDITKAEAYLSRYAGDVNPKLSGALNKARAHLDNARRELAQTLPNYLVVVKQALLANSAADEVFAQAVDQHEYLESVRHQLKTARSLFATSSDKSERYIRNNKSDVGEEPERLLTKAREAFARVDEEADIVRQLEIAKRALELANSAYDRASDDVAKAEAQRAAIRRKREREEREARDAEARRRRSYYSSSSTYTSGYGSGGHSSGGGFGGFSSSSSFSGGFGGSSGSSGW